jgi:hypothetical protein
MRTIALASACLSVALISGCQPAAEAPPVESSVQASEDAYSPDAADQPGTPRQVHCQIGEDREAIEARLREDPFQRLGLAHVEIIPFEPSMAADAFADLI